MKWILFVLLLIAVGLLLAMTISDIRDLLSK